MPSNANNLVITKNTITASTRILTIIDYYIGNKQEHRG
jgi:hypothetical protein